MRSLSGLRLVSVDEALVRVPYPLVIVTVGDGERRASMTTAWFTRVS